MAKKRIFRHKAVTPEGKAFRFFATKKEIEEWIASQIEAKGLDWRAGYLIQFRDGQQLNFVKMNNEPIKTLSI